MGLIFFIKGSFEGLIFGGAYVRGKFVFQNRLGQPNSWTDIYHFGCVLLCTSPQEAYIWRGDLTEGFLRYEFGGLIFGVAYFRNFMVYNSQSCNKTSSLLVCSRCKF